jgi:lipoate-protein ligase A
MYAVVLSFQRRPELRAIDRAHRFVLGVIAGVLATHVPGLAVQGICDLAIGDKKVSGNSVRVKRRHLLYHGTLLYDFPRELIGQCLAMPPRVPDYRAARSHDDFVANLPLDVSAIRRLLRSAWQANEPCPDWPQALTAQLTADRYECAAWTEQF